MVVHARSGIGRRHSSKAPGIRRYEVPLNARVETVTETRDSLAVLQDLVALTKPRITALVVVTMVTGALVAPGGIDTAVLLLSILGTSLVVGSANALNMVLERDVDAKMKRTWSRPLPAGRLASSTALVFGLGLGLAGTALLAAFVNATTTLLGLIALASYVLAYTPLKRISPIALYVGAVPGAMPPLMGWTTVTGAVSFEAFLVFAVLLVWQVPHFCAIALARRDEYARAGLLVHPVVHGESRTKRVIVGSALATAVVSVVPFLVGWVGVAYLVAVGGFGAAFVGLSARGLRTSDTHRWARSVFFASMPYLVLLYGALIAAAG